MTGVWNPHHPDKFGTLRLAGAPGSQVASVACDSTRVHAGHEDWAFSGVHWASLKDKFSADLAGFHERFPDEQGPEAARGRRMFFPKLAAPVFAVLVESLMVDGSLQRSGPWLHLPTHTLALSRDDEALWQRIRPWLAESPLDPPWMRDLAKRAGHDEAAMRRLLQKLARQGKPHQVVRDLFYDTGRIGELAAIAAAIAREHGGIDAARFRDAIGLGRKRTIQILEFFDRVGYLRRVRDDHLPRRDNPWRESGAEVNSAPRQHAADQRGRVT